MLSISSTFYEQLFLPISLCRKSQSQIVIREKLSKTLSCKKGMSKMLVKLTPGVIFTNLLAQSADVPAVIVLCLW